MNEFSINGRCLKCGNIIYSTGGCPCWYLPEEQIPNWIKCPNCDGKGCLNTDKCPTCNGFGIINEYTGLSPYIITD